MVTAQKKIATVEDAVLQMERYSRGFNLRFGGIPETTSTDPDTAYDQVKQLLHDTFGMTEVEIENAHRSGKPPKSASDKPRHILAKFIYRTERQTVLDRARAIKNSVLENMGVFVLRDLPAADVAEKRSLRDVMKKAYQDRKNPVFRNGNLYINGSKYVAPSPSSTSP